MAKINQAMQDLFRYNAAILPQKRSSFDKSHSHTTTLDSAYLVPIMWDRVVPGDEKKIRYSGLARMSTPKVPVMDQANLDVWCFYVPDRLWWTNAKKFYGENLDASFNPDGEYVMPYLVPSQYMVLSSEDRSYGIGSLSDYLGFPVGDSVPDAYDDDPAFFASAGLHRSYQLIWNEWFRNSSVQPALRLNDGDNVTDDEYDVICQLRKVNKYPDYFTSLLREPQAGDDVTLPLGEWAPVVTRVQNHDNSAEGLHVQSAFGGDLMTSGNIAAALYSGASDYQLYTLPSTTVSGEPEDKITISNLWADLTSASSATINNLRAAITVQQLLEIDASAGKRYQQLISAHFGTFVPDATLQRPELLGATRTTIGMRQVLQTSESTETSALGQTAAFSVTNVDNEWICNKSFTEPGFIMVLAAVRVAQSYSQGLDPLLTKLNRYDHYYPVFDNLGNQPVPVSAITFTNATSNDLLTDNSPDDFKATFGYAEAWTEYRVKQNRVSGLMRPDAQNSLSMWNYSSMFRSIPALNNQFIQEDEFLIDRSIAFTEEPQFLLDSYFEYYDTKNMSVHSIPGLLRL